MNKEIQKHSKKMLTFLALSLGSVVGTPLYAGLDDSFQFNLHNADKSLVRFYESLQRVQSLSEEEQKNSGNTEVIHFVNNFHSLFREERLKIWHTLEPILKKITFKFLPADQKWELWQQSEPEVQKSTLKDLELEQMSGEAFWEAGLSLWREWQEENFVFLCRLLDAIQKKCFFRLTPEGRSKYFSRLSKENKAKIYFQLDEDVQKNNFSNLTEGTQWKLWEKFTPEEKDRHATTFFQSVCHSENSKIAESLEFDQPKAAAKIRRERGVQARNQRGSRH